MLFDDTYNETASTSYATYRDKGSKFLAYTFCVYNEKEVKKRLQEVQKKENSANHYCYAYVLHPDQSSYRMNDDGEPNSTAGRQIFNEIKKKNLTNILVIVVRYFGGTKLGIPGLIKAYKTTTFLALESVKIIKKQIQEKYIINFDYTQMNNVMKIIKKYKLKIIKSNFNIECEIEFLVEKKRSIKLLDDIKANHNLQLLY